MRILLSNHRLNLLGGSETWTYTMARELVRIGHQVSVFTKEKGMVGENISEFCNVMTAVPEISDFELAILNHNTCLSEINKNQRNKDIPTIYTSHGVIPSLEQPIPGAHAYISVSEEVAYHLAEMGFASLVIRNGIDCERFKPGSLINSRPRKALILNNASFEGINNIIDACNRMDIKVITAGNISTDNWDVENIINDVDIVFALGRGCYEAMACGRNVIVAGQHGLDGVVSDGSMNFYKLFNCSGRYNSGDITINSILAELEKYNEAQGLRNREYALRHYNITNAASKYLALGRMVVEGSFELIDNPVSVNCSKNELSLMRKDLEETRKSLEDHIEAIENFKNTLSWKVTTPLREGKKLTREIFQKIRKLSSRNKRIKIAGITRVRNEQAIIKDTLDHFSQWCNHGIYVYDDCSTDDTVQICKNHENVEKIITGSTWDINRQRAEYETRDVILKECQKDSPDWIIYFDADERIDWDFTGFDDYDAVRMKLFDFYITEEDKDKKYYERRFLGPEYRKIVMFFRNSRHLKYHISDQREVTLPPGPKILDAGYVKHYGKAISIEEWEETCEYYNKYFPEPYASKWASRKGKAVHSLSDFDRTLITWDQKDHLGVPL